jgi:hypothetical protein
LRAVTRSGARILLASKEFAMTIATHSATARLKAWGQIAIAAVLALFGLAVAATAIGHATDPAHVGLWSGPTAFFFGKVDDGSFARMAHAHQLPDSTLYVVTAMVVGLCWFVSRELLGFARAGLKRQAP